MGRKDQDREDYEKRAKDVRDRAAKGESMDQILASRQAEVSKRLLEKAIREDREDRGR